MNNENPIFRSLAIIEKQIHEKLTVESLAASIPLSKYHYQRMFRDAMGESVMQYVTRRRLVLAAAELTKTETTILEIALKYGYDSHEGFTRSFRAHMGITPTEYRKYHESIYFPILQKERFTMTYSKPMGEMIRELNDLIIQTKETTGYTRKHKDDVAYYSQFWDFVAKRCDAMAEDLKGTLDRITAIAKKPDEIFARFMIINALEDTAFRTHTTAFQAGLTSARAISDHRTILQPICEKYKKLSQNARIKAEKIAEFFQELSTLIFQDMRENAKQHIQIAIEKGHDAAKVLSSDPNLPYAYIAEEISAITETLSSTPLEEITVSHLEDLLFRLEIAALAADTDALRTPSHKQIFDEIFEFKEQIAEMMQFFQSLPCSPSQAFTESEKEPSAKHTAKTRANLDCTSGYTLLFYLKGEVQKLNRYLNTDQTAALNAICDKLQSAISLAFHAEDKAADSEIQKQIQEVYNDMLKEAESLGAYGGPIQYIAEEVRELTAI